MASTLIAALVVAPVYGQSPSPAASPAPSAASPAPTPPAAAPQPGAPAAAPARPAAPADAETPADTAERALALASYAFEYRDFARVVATLEPWVHPPRIADRARLADAQRLLGVSLHVQGETARAEAEFAALLQFDPEHRLDPFVVPPAVIDTFERVRTSMRPVLDRILAERRRLAGVTDPAPVGPPAAQTLSPVFAYAPFGLSHFLALDEPGWGALFLGLQVLGLSANASGYWLRRGLVDADGNTQPDDLGTSDDARTLQLAGLVLFGAAWVASGLHAHGEWPDPTPLGPPTLSPAR